MNTRKAVSAVFVFVLTLATTLPVANASEANQETQLTFNHPIDVPGQTLPAGTYTFELVNTTTNKDIVQIFNSDHKQVATIMTIPCQHPVATGNTIVTVAYRNSSRSTVLKDWFYPGTLTGHEFVYPKEEERELVLAAHPDTLAPRTGSYWNDAIVSSGS